MNSGITTSHALPDNVQIAMGNLFDEYINTLKPVLAMAESLTQTFPGPILNEIRAVNDHVSRCFIEGRTETESLNELNKAKGHLTRATLDCYKILLIEYDSRVKNFFDTYKDVCIAVVNDGKFLPRLTSLYDHAKNLAVKAKQTESQSFPNKEEAYTDYKNAIIAFNAVEKHIKENADGLANAAQFAKDQTKANHKFSIYSALWGTLFGIIATLLMNLLL